MVKKIICLGVILIMCMSAGLFIGCEPEPDFALDRVSVYIGLEYQDEFSSKKFTVEDFKWNNIEKIEYVDWYYNREPERGCMTVYLKKHSKKRVLDAVKHFNTLEFVYKAETNAIYSISKKSHI